MVLLTVKEAAERASVSESLVYEWISEGVLPHLRLGKLGKRGCIRIAQEELDVFLAGCRVEGSINDDQDDDEELKHI